ncbi:MAG: hypothetical protein D8M59_11580 [Planctomycetes bacterium]|nr:hypothetical protein [Planctomycetota bacterium]NOG55402.1 hypothetical protein [Planctomycetota bacterium]
MADSEMHIKEPPTFEADIEAHVPWIQDLLASVLEATCGQGDVPITAICERLGIHRKLAWQVRNVAYSPDPFRAVRYMPTEAGLNTLAASIGGQCGMPDLAESVRLAGQTYARLVEVHAGDRTSMEMLVESCATAAAAATAGPGSEGDESADIKWRERSFQGNSFTWGAYAKTQLSASVLNYSAAKPGWFDQVQVRGLMSLKRVRPNVRWIVGQSVVIDGDDPNPRAPVREPIDAAAAAEMGGVPLLPEFCSSPLPQLERRPAEQGLLNDELLPAPVGTIGQQTIVTGEVIRALAPAYATSHNKRALFGAVVRTPSEVFMYDQFVHRDLFPGVERELCVFSELNSQIAQDESDRLPISAAIEHRGCGIGSARSPDVPGYMKLLQYVFDCMGWEPREFELYRIRVPYPPMPSSVVIRHPLPPEG